MSIDVVLLDRDQMLGIVRGDLDHCYFHVSSKVELFKIEESGIQHFVDSLVAKAEKTTNNKITGVAYGSLVDFAEALRLPMLQATCRESYVFFLYLQDYVGAMELYKIGVFWLKTGIINLVTAYDTLRLSTGELMAYKASEEYLPRLRGAIVDSSYKEKYAKAILAEL